MNVSQQAVTNAVNLAFLMVSLSHIILKAQFRAQRYLSETIKMLPEMPEPDLISRIWQRLTRFGCIRTRPFDDFAA